MSSVADIILRSMETQQRTNEARIARTSQFIGDLGNTVAEIPSLVKKGREEKDLQNINDAFASGAMDGDLEAAYHAAASAGGKSPAGASRLTELALYVEREKRTNALSMLQQRALAQATAEKKQASDEQDAQRAALGAAAQPTTTMDDAPLATTPAGTVDPTGWQRQGFTTTQPSGGDIARKALASGKFGPKDVPGLMALGAPEQRVSIEEMKARAAAQRVQAQQTGATARTKMTTDERGAAAAARTAATVRGQDVRAGTADKQIAGRAAEGAANRAGRLDIAKMQDDTRKDAIEATRVATDMAHADRLTESELHALSLKLHAISSRNHDRAAVLGPALKTGEVDDATKAAADEAMHAYEFLHGGTDDAGNPTPGALDTLDAIIAQREKQPIRLPAQDRGAPVKRQAAPAAEGPTQADLRKADGLGLRWDPATRTFVKK